MPTVAEHRARLTADYGSSGRSRPCNSRRCSGRSPPRGYGCSGHSRPCAPGSLATSARFFYCSHRVRAAALVVFIGEPHRLGEGLHELAVCRIRFKSRQLRQLIHQPPPVRFGELTKEVNGVLHLFGGDPIL